jgi:hypothetical protein
MQERTLSLAGKGEVSMRWSRATDYHGSRSYESDVPTVSQFRILLAWLVNIATGRLRKARRPAPTVLLRSGERRFTLLSTSARLKPTDSGAEPPIAAPRGSRLRHED